MKVRKSVFISCSILILTIIAYAFTGQIVNHLFTKTEEFKIIATQLNGKQIPVRVVKLTKGLFISGGHGWSIGSERNSYGVIFEDENNTVRWEGEGVPIILQNQGSLFYLAVFDRETNQHQMDFKCYVWDGVWKIIPVNIFPKRLAINNLMTLDSDSSVSFEDPGFRTSLLARFWFCIESGLHDWEVSDSMIDAEFVTKFVQSIKETRGAKK